MPNQRSSRLKKRGPLTLGSVASGALESVGRNNVGMALLDCRRYNGMAVTSAFVKSRIRDNAGYNSGVNVVRATRAIGIRRTGDASQGGKVLWSNAPYKSPTA